MRITFRIQYRTAWGESLRVLVGKDTVVELSTADGYNWQGEGLYTPELPGAPVSYRYEVCREGRSVRREFGAIPHTFCPGAGGGGHYLLQDHWRDLPMAAHRFSSAFCTHVEGDGGTCPPHTVGKAVVVFRALFPSGNARHEVPALAGSCPALGDWGQSAPVRMHEVRPHVWQAMVAAASLPPHFEYKFVAVRPEDGGIAAWEEGDNRAFDTPALHPGEVYAGPEEEIFFPGENYRIAGCAIPVFSIRSEGSFGVGDFGDLRAFIDWAADTGQRAVQILPINDTTMTGTWTDSYPYNSISIYAFHPMYVDVRQLPPLRDAGQAAAFEQKRFALNALPQVDYEEVNRWKRAYLKAVFLQEKDDMLASDGYRAFYRDNADWLRPYAAFCYLRDRFRTPDFNQWGEYATYCASLADELCSPANEAYPDTAFHCVVQYLLHVQLLEACNHGRERGVVVKGDIPIGISRTSVEAWVEPYYFNMDGQAGAPPDAFSTNGQNWGMPTYNWKAMEQDGYRWWLRRFRKMSDYFTAYRIDHILGFFRIWEIPLHSVHGLLGQFSPALPMSVDEIQGYGLRFRKDFMTRPFINDALLDQLFGSRAQQVRDTFVTRLDGDTYAMRPEFDTQRKIEAHFAGRDNEESNRMREGLYALVSDVLFIPDRDNPEMFHPRIAVQGDYIYRQLDTQGQDAFNRLYNDYYYCRHNDFWYREAMKKLPVLTQSTSMLVCGEDLGMVPGCVPWAMEQLQILSLEVERMPKQPGEEFGHVHDYPSCSVCTIGTHDMSTLRGWWEEDRDVSARYFHHELGYEGDVPAQAPGWLCEEVVRRHLHSSSMLCILAWQDWMSMDEGLRNPDIASERINVPANPRNYWRWRMHLTLEELVRQDAFNDKLRRLIGESGR